MRSKKEEADDDDDDGWEGISSKVSCNRVVIHNLKIIN